jgi:signal peptidase I
MTRNAVTLKKDTQLFLDVSNRLLSAGCRVRFRASGLSMSPAIYDGESVTVERVESSAVKPGDVLLYQHNQRPFVHRVVRIQHSGNDVVGFVLRGDAKRECDYPVRSDQVLGRVAQSQKPRSRPFSYLRSFAAMVRSHRLAPRAMRHT